MDYPRLLIIDDEPAIATLIKRIAEPCGFRVNATSDWATFKHSLDSEPPDAICLDLGMPGFDGIELLGFLADRNCTCPLLIVSGFDPRIISTSMRLAEARGLTVAAAIPKPIDSGALRDALGALAAAH
jgi:DNA-binding response OmpR family regulator